MRRPILVLACLALASALAHGQSFEVASVKPASPDATGIGCSGGPGTGSPGIWRCTNVPLSFLITQAYGFPAYQFPPNAPCCRDRFDVAAKMPEGANKEQFHQMMRNLLMERFKFTFHRQQKEMTIFELTVGPTGAKMKESADAAPPPEDPWAVPEHNMGKDGYPVFPAGRGGLAGLDGHYRWTGFALSLPEIVKTLSFHLGGPVVDATGLKGKYDIDITWNLDMAWILERAGRKDLAGELPDEGSRGPTLTRAVQDQLGLKLTSKKGPGDIVVVDHVEKVPIEPSSAQEDLSFDAAAVKPTTGPSLCNLAITPGRLTARAVSLHCLIGKAYNVADDQLVGISSWMDADVYSIAATTAQPLDRDQMMAMLRKLLAERFQLTVHTEIRKSAVLALVINKGGSKLQPLAEGESPAPPASLSSAQRMTLSWGPATSDLIRWLNFYSPRNLGGQLVVDRTGLKGNYKIWVAFDNQMDPEGRGGKLDVDIQSALPQQLGLSLRPEQADVPFVVIDKAARLEVQ